MKEKKNTFLYIRDAIRLFTVLFMLPWTTFLLERIFNMHLNVVNASMVIVMYILFGGFWCGWLCPFGNLDYFISKIGNYLVPKTWKKEMVFNRKIHAVLGYLRYFFILPFIFLAVSYENITIARIAFFLVIVYFSVKAFAVLVMPLFMPRFFCKYVCFHKALGNIINTYVPLWQLRRNENTCIACNRCTKACPMDIDVMHTKRITGGDCIGCFECCDTGSGCPEKAGALELYFIRWKVSPKVLAILALVVYVIYCAVRLSNL